MNKAGNSYFSKPWVDHYDTHVSENLNYPRITINQLFKETVSENSARQFIVFNGNRYTYKEIGELVSALSKNLNALGLLKGDRVAVMLPNIPQFIVSYYGILEAGAIVVAINPNYKKSEIEFLLQDSEPIGIICLEQHVEMIREITRQMDLKFIITANTEEKISSKRLKEKSLPSSINNIHDFNTVIQNFQTEAHGAVEVTPEDPAIFQYSGGTTGVPKAAIGLHKNIIANTHQFAVWCDLIKGKEVILAAIPLYHVYGMVLAMNLALWVNASLVLIDNPRDIEKILEQIQDEKVTFYPGVPTMYHAINQHESVLKGGIDLTSIKACISGSFTLQPEIKKQFERLTGGKLLEGYGLSEAPTATHCNPLNGVNKTGSIGMPLPDVLCRIVDLETGGTDLPPGRNGELIIQGPQIMSGYYKHPDETREVLCNGWLFTGDVARMDEDGYFYIVDRKKSLIKVSGFQVWPNEVETVINQLPGVAESAVGGVPDLESGERVIAWVVAKEKQRTSEEEILNICRENLVDYKVPSEVFFIQNLPRSGVGKILRRELISDYLKKK